MELLEKILWEVRFGFMALLCLIGFLGFYVVEDNTAKLIFAVWFISCGIGGLLAAIIPLIGGREDES